MTSARPARRLGRPGRDGRQVVRRRRHVGGTDASVTTADLGAVTGAVTGALAGAVDGAVTGAGSDASPEPRGGRLAFRPRVHAQPPERLEPVGPAHGRRAGPTWGQT